MDLTTVEAPSVEEALKSHQGHYMIGSGGHREVYRTPGSFWCYKFPNEEGSSYAGWDNLGEWSAYKKIIAKFGDSHQIPTPKGPVYVPRTHLLIDGECDIIAMQYVDIKGAPDWNTEFRKAARQALAVLGLSDSHSGNLVEDQEGKHWIVDMASGRLAHAGEEGDSGW